MNFVTQRDLVVKTNDYSINRDDDERSTYNLLSSYVGERVATELKDGAMPDGDGATWLEWLLAAAGAPKGSRLARVARNQVNSAELERRESEAFYAKNAVWGMF